MSWVLFTRLMIVAFISAIFTYDGFALSKGGFDATISNQLLTLARANPIVACIIGIVIGHLFWPQKVKCPKCGYNGNLEDYGGK